MEGSLKNSSGRYVAKGGWAGAGPKNESDLFLGEGGHQKRTSNLCTAIVIGPASKN